MTFAKNEVATLYVVNRRRKSRHRPRESGDNKRARFGSHRFVEAIWGMDVKRDDSYTNLATDVVEEAQQ